MKDSSGSSTVRFVIGVIGMVIFGILLVISLALMTLIHPLFHIFLPLFIVSIALFVLSFFLLNSGRRRKNIIGRLSRYMAELSSNKDVMRIDDMAGVTGFLPMLIKNDLRMMKRWELNFDLYTDKEETTIIKGKNEYDAYLRTERERERISLEEAERQKKLMDPETANLESFKEEGKAILDKIRAANVLLTEKDISESLTELEKTTKRIFDYIENYPEKLPETRKLMSYHLPTTMKLIEKYCEYEGMDYETQDIAAAKADIKKTLTAANEAFANYLNSLYRTETLDVTTDAEVLTKMFEKDGLTGNKFDIKGDEK